LASSNTYFLIKNAKRNSENAPSEISFDQRYEWQHVSNEGQHSHKSCESTRAYWPLNRALPLVNTKDCLRTNSKLSSLPLMSLTNPIFNVVCGPCSSAWLTKFAYESVRTASGLLQYSCTACTSVQAPFHIKPFKVCGPGIACWPAPDEASGSLLTHLVLQPTHYRFTTQTPNTKHFTTTHYSFTAHVLHFNHLLLQPTHLTFTTHTLQSYNLHTTVSQPTHCFFTTDTLWFYNSRTMILQSTHNSLRTHTL
jgi:hypothetical protein